MYFSTQAYADYDNKAALQNYVFSEYADFWTVGYFVESYVMACYEPRTSNPTLLTPRPPSQWSTHLANSHVI